jgi:hypothetical protein
MPEDYAGNSGYSEMQTPMYGGGKPAPPPSQFNPYAVGQPGARMQGAPGGQQFGNNIFGTQNPNQRPGSY